MAIKWRLREVLDQKGTNPYALARAMGDSELAPKLYRLVRPKEISRLDFSTISGIISGLRKITGEPIEVGDLLVYVPDEPGEGGTNAA